MKRTTRTILSLAVAAATLAVPGSAIAATDVGRTTPDGGTAVVCNPDTGHFTTFNAGPNPYVATVSGVITEWRFRAEANPGTVVMQVANVVDNSTYTPIVESAPAALTANGLNRVATRVPISAGQIVGLRAVTSSNGCYALGQTDFTNHQANPAPLPGGGPAMYGGGSGSAATNVAATIEPDADADGFGDETQDGCPANAGRSDDCIAPTVKIDSGPKKKTKKAKAKFVFSSNDAAATFQCSLDGESFSSCSSPLKVKVKKKKAKHALTVRAIDANGNRSGEETYKWKVKPKKKKAGKA